MLKIFCIAQEIYLKKKEHLHKLILNKNTKKSASQLLNIYSVFTLKHPKISFFLDLSESDYFDYHTGIRFTIFAEDVRGEIARGGRYISKKEYSSENSTGFTCYMDTIIRASSLKEKITRILIPFDTTSERKKDLISQNFVIETFFGNKEDIKNKAMGKKIKACLINDKIIFL